MNTSNIFNINNWKLKKFFIIIAVIQISVISLVILDLIGLGLPFLRNFVGFIYLTFVPGILILRSLRMQKLGITETILYSVGLSIGVLMFTGFFMDILYPLIGIKNPITLIPLISTITVLVIIFSIICYLRDGNKQNNHYNNNNNNNNNNNSIELKDFFSVQFMFLFIIPFLAIIGTYLMNFYQNNIILMFLIIFIGLIVLLVAYGRIPKKYLPFVIFIISLSLLFSNSLISNYLSGWDINKEYYFANLVITNGIWNINLPGNVNAMLSITILAPIYSILLKTNLIWIFKIIYPLIFALVPLALYRILQDQLNDKIAFFSSLFFVFFFTFYTEMIQLARQEIAELFLVLLILLIVDKNKNIGKSILLVIFAVSLAVSHYGISYLMMIVFFSAVLLLFLIEKLEKFKAFTILKFSDSYDMINNKNFLLNFVILFIIFAIGWYTYITSSHALVTAIQIGDQITSSIYTEFLNPNAVQGLYILQKEAATPLHTISKILQIFGQFLIIIGFFAVLSRFSKLKFNPNYLMYSLAGLFLLILSITIPYFSSALNTSRLYQITLIFLAPFCLIGAISILKLLNKPFKRKLTEKSALKIFSIFLILFLFFNTGFSFEITNDIPISYSLSNHLDYPKFNSEDFNGAKWVMNNKNDNVVYADDNRVPLLYSYDNNNIGSYYENNLKLNKLINNSYIYLGSFNTLNGKMLESGNYSSTEIIQEKDEIYDNGGSKVFLYNSIINFS